MNTKRPASGHRILRAATQKFHGLVKVSSQNKRYPLPMTKSSAIQIHQNMDMFIRRKSDSSSALPNLSQFQRKSGANPGLAETRGGKSMPSLFFEQINSKSKRFATNCYTSIEQNRNSPSLNSSSTQVAMVIRKGVPTTLKSNGQKRTQSSRNVIKAKSMRNTERPPLTGGRSGQLLMAPQIISPSENKSVYGVPHQMLLALYAAKCRDLQISHSNKEQENRFLQYC